jgi:hypothetical protein
VLSAAGAPAPAWQEHIDELVTVAARGQEVCGSGQVYYRLTPGHELVQYAWAKLPPGMARLKLAGFLEQWRAEVVERNDQRWLLDVRTPSNLWQRCLGRAPRLLVEIVLGGARGSAGQVVPVRVRLEPVDCGRGKAMQVLTELGPQVLSSLQTYLGTQTTRQEQERFPLAQAVHVQSQTAGLAVTGRLRDIGREELSLVLPCSLPHGAVTLTLNRWASPVTIMVPGWVRDCLATGAKVHEAEVRLGG